VRGEEREKERKREKEGAASMSICTRVVLKREDTGDRTFAAGLAFPRRFPRAAAKRPRQLPFMDPTDSTASTCAPSLSRAA